MSKYYIEWLLFLTLVCIFYDVAVASPGSVWTETVKLKLFTCCTLNLMDSLNYSQFMHNLKSIFRHTIPISAILYAMTYVWSWHLSALHNTPVHYVHPPDQILSFPLFTTLMFAAMLSVHNSRRTVKLMLPHQERSNTQLSFPPCLWPDPFVFHPVPTLPRFCSLASVLSCALQVRGALCCLVLNSGPNSSEGRKSLSMCLASTPARLTTLELILTQVNERSVLPRLWTECEMVAFGPQRAGIRGVCVCVNVCDSPPQTFEAWTIAKFIC